MNLLFRRAPLVVFMLVYSHEVLADSCIERNLGTEASYYDTSDNYHRDTLTLDYQQTKKNKCSRKLKTGVSAARHLVTSDNRNYQANELEFNASKQITKNFTLEGELGAINIKKPIGSEHQTEVTHKVKAIWKPVNKVSLSVMHSEDPLFKKKIALDSSGNILNVDATTAEIRVMPTNRVYMSGKVTQEDVSDGNQSNADNIGIYYGVMLADKKPRLWLGLEAGYLDYDQKVPEYWSPNNYRKVALNVHGKVPLSERVDLNTNISSGRGKDDNSNGYASTLNASIGLDFEINKKMELGVAAKRIESTRDNSKWNADGAMLTFNYRM